MRSVILHKAIVTRAVAVALCCSGTAGLAAVRASDATGFDIEIEREIRATPDQVMAALQTPGAWWSSAHSWSGEAANMRITAAEPGGCWCETLPHGGAVEHGRVMAWETARHRILMRAELGPLQGLAAVGKLEWQAEAQSGGMTRIRWRYAVSGRGLDQPANLAALVDQVLSEQVSRLAAHLAAQTGPVSGNPR